MPPAAVVVVVIAVVVTVVVVVVVVVVIAVVVVVVVVTVVVRVANSIVSSTRCRSLPHSSAEPDTIDRYSPTDPLIFTDCFLMAPRPPASSANPSLLTPSHPRALWPAHPSIC
ncbi:hypothetical protein J6590_106858 [Homalodisca vitripennis]|nr:hypothetical protein J6590_106858 [Homalodisca vitripennis]